MSDDEPSLSNQGATPDLTVGSLVIAVSFDRGMQRTFFDLFKRIEDYALIFKETDAVRHRFYQKIGDTVASLKRHVLQLPFVEAIVETQSTLDVWSFEVSFDLTKFSGSEFRDVLEQWYLSLDKVPLDFTIQFSDGHAEIEEDFIIEHECSEEAFDELSDEVFAKAKAQQDALRSQLTLGQKLLNFLVGASASLVFGIIDNGVMFLGGEMIDGNIQAMGFDSMTAAGIGNTMSDMVGVACGGIVFQALQKAIGVKGEGW